MGKKNHKFSAQLRTAGAAVVGTATPPAPSAAVTRLLATVAQTAPLLNESPPDWDETRIREIVQTLPQQEQARVAVFFDRFASLGAQLKDAHERSEATRSRIEADGKEAQAGVDRRLAAAKAALEEVEASRQALEKQRGEQDALRRSLVQRETALVQCEAALRSGLIDERENALKALRHQVSELEARRDRLPSEIEDHRIRLMDQARADAEALLVKVRERDDELLRREIELQAQGESHERRERQLQLEKRLLQDRREALDKELREDARREVDTIQAQLQRSEAKVGKLHDQIDSMQRELDELEQLRTSSGGDPRRLVENMESLRQKNRELDRHVQELLASRSQEDGERLRGERDDLQERLDTAEAELFTLRRRESQWKRSVTEREDWEATRQVMESNRALLQKAVGDLRVEVGSLLDGKQHEAVFPELTRMDRALDKPVATSPVPEELSRFVEDLQARIAYTEPNKVLHFRKEELQLFVGGLAMSQLHVFQGISGTGKTTLAAAFAQAMGGKLTRVPVQAGWRDRSDVVGHYNAFEKRYYEREALQAIYQAQTPAFRDLVHVVLLDEMNLSRPEQYFADFLSAMEMGRGKRWIRLLETAPAQAPALLREGREIELPSNLWFIGTANQDETTNAFADKTHDRAFVLDLPKQELHGRNPPRPRKPEPWSASSLAAAFDQACEAHADHIGALVQRLNASTLTSLLNDRFELGWGNRLERQMLRFMPVVMAGGGTDALALDHLLASRMFRDGKVTGRYDIDHDDLTDVRNELLTLWKDCGLAEQPKRCLRAIDRDALRLERRG